MTPKEKAEDLVCKYISNQNSWYLENLVDGLRISQAKSCALIAVDEMLNDDWYLTSSDYLFKRKAYWQEVKQEIEKL